MRTSQKTASKSEKKLKLSNFENFHFTPLSVYLRNRKRERENPPTYYPKLLTQFIQHKKKALINWMNN